MSQQPATPTEDQTRELIRKLADFRNGMPEEQQLMMDALVTRATSEQPPQEAPGDAHAPTQEQVDAFFTKLQEWRDTLPAADRPLVDDLVIEAGAVEPDVEAHRIHWVRFGFPGLQAQYDAVCKAGAGPRFHAFEAKLWTGTSSYTCWDGSM